MNPSGTCWPFIGEVIFTVGVLVAVVVFVATAAYVDMVIQIDAGKRESMILRQITTISNGSKDTFRLILARWCFINRQLHHMPL